MSVFGVGVYEKGRHSSRDSSGRLTKGYMAWKHMLERCYSSDYLRKFPTYRGCSVAGEFINFQSFMLWAEVQVGFDVDGTCLDKDLRIKGSKVYSPATCAFIPAPVNGLLNKHKKRRGDLPIGVSVNGGRFMATLCVNGKNKNLGRYESPEVAFAAYKRGKEAYVKEVATKYASVISSDVLSALMCYSVERTD